MPLMRILSGKVAIYLPKIDEKLIPELYRLAKELGMPMTRLVNVMIVEGAE